MSEDTMEVRRRLLAASARNLGDMLRRRVDLTPTGTAYLRPQNLPEGPEEWTAITWREVQDRAHDIAAGLLELGVRRQERVAICGDTTVDWVLVDLGVACSGAATTTVYQNSHPEDVDHIVSASQSVVYVAQNCAQAAKVVDHEGLREQVHHVVLIDDDRPTAPRRAAEGHDGDRDRPDEATRVAADPRVMSLDELVDLGHRRRRRDPGCVQRAIDATRPEDLATLIYTSGTTGLPKGVELPHQAWTYMGVAMESWDPLEPGDLQYLWLPLAHVFGKCLLAVQLTIGYTCAVDGRVDRIVTGMSEVHPTFMCGVPRIFEKVRAKVIATGGLQGRVSRWAFAQGRDAAQLRRDRRPVPWHLKARLAVADRLVFSRLRAAMGGRVRMMICGSAKLSEQVQRWFDSAGIPVVEGYGSTETSAIAFFNVPKKPRFGTVGKVCPGIEAELSEDGELLLRGPTIATCYHDDPQRTAETWDEEGWFHTGDIGVFDDEGNLTITDRKRDLIKTSGGKYVAPQKVEATIMANCPMVSRAVVVGEGHKYVVALLTLDREAVEDWAAGHGMEGRPYAELTAEVAVRQAVQQQVDRANSHLERWETIKKFAVLDHEFDGSRDLVTENLKVRRDAVTKAYADLIESLYDHDEG